MGTKISKSSAPPYSRFNQASPIMDKIYDKKYSIDSIKKLLQELSPTALGKIRYNILTLLSDPHNQKKMKPEYFVRLTNILEIIHGFIPLNYEERFNSSTYRNE